MAPTHDFLSRLLHCLEPDPESLWDEVRPLIRQKTGVLVIDDSTLENLQAQHIELVAHHWSGNHQAVVRGINLITALWLDGNRLYPLDYRIFNKNTDGKTKNDHFADLTTAVRARGLQPRAVLFDGWYASVENLKEVRDFGWVFVTRFKGNRLVRIDHREASPVGAVPIAASGTVVWVPGYGEVKVFRVITPKGNTTHWATNDLGMDEPTRLMFGELSWSIREYLRGLKKSNGVERCQIQAVRGRWNHIGFAIRAYVRSERNWPALGRSWFATKFAIIREAVTRHVADTSFCVPSEASSGLRGSASTARSHPDPVHA